MPSTLITGANRGLGVEFARQYAADVWQVYAGYRDLSSASKLRRLANTSDDKIWIMALDVTDPASIKAAAAELDGQAIDVHRVESVRAFKEVPEQEIIKGYEH